MTPWWSFNLSKTLIQKNSVLCLYSVMPSSYILYNVIIKIHIKIVVYLQNIINKKYKYNNIYEYKNDFIL